MYLTAPACGIDRAARHTAGGFRRFDADLVGECGHLLIIQKILSNSPFGRTTQTVVAFDLLYHCAIANSATSVLYISASIALLYVEVCFRG